MEFRGRRRKEERERKCWELRVNSDEGIFGFSKAIVSNNPIFFKKIHMSNR